MSGSTVKKFTPAGPIYFILGGPGSGKGTNCAKLSVDFGLVHLCAGELLRIEMKNKSELSDIIKSHVENGQIVPMEITIKLLIQEMKNKPNTNGYLLDGFPRKMDQALKFEEEVVIDIKVIYFTLTEKEMWNRIKKRKMTDTNVREDDLYPIIIKRFQTNIRDCMPVVERYKKMKLVVEIDSSGTIDEVYALVKSIFEKQVKVNSSTQ